MCVSYRSPILGYEPGPEWKDESIYRYVVDGVLIERFEDEEEALAFFKKDRALCDAVAREDSVNFARVVYNDTMPGPSILISDRVGELEKESA